MSVIMYIMQNSLLPYTQRHLEELILSKKQMKKITRLAVLVLGAFISLSILLDIIGTDSNIVLASFILVIVGILLIFGVFDYVIWANFVIFVIRLIFGVFHNVISDQGSRPPK